VPRSAFHRARTFAPQRPFERPAQASPSDAAWPPRGRLSTPFHHRRSLRNFRGQALVHVFRCQRCTRFSEPRRRSPTSATYYDARAHPTSRRSSRASETFVPLLAGTNRCRLRWPRRRVATSMACEPRFVSARITRGAFHLRGRVESRAEALGEKARCAALEGCRKGPPRNASGTWGHRHDGMRVWRVRTESGQSRSHADASSRKATPL